MTPTDEQVEAAKTEFFAVVESGNFADEAEAASGTVEVKGLEWYANKDRQQLFHADVPTGGYYSVMLDDARRWGWRRPAHIAFLWITGGEDEAKVAAQADYEARIRSALLPPQPAALPGKGADNGGALVSQPHPEGEAVAWRASHSHGGFTYYDADPSAALSDFDTSIEPLYLHPAPTLQGAGLIEALKLATERLAQIDCVIWDGNRIPSKDDAYDEMKRIASRGHADASNSLRAALSTQRGAE